MAPTGSVTGDWLMIHSKTSIETGVRAKLWEALDDCTVILANNPTLTDEEYIEILKNELRAVADSPDLEAGFLAKVKQIRANG